MCRFGPERADSRLGSFAEQLDVRRGRELQVAHIQVHSLLGPCAGVDKEGQQRVVATTLARSSIDTLEHRVDLRFLEVVDGRSPRPLEWNAQDALGLLDT